MYNVSQEFKDIILLAGKREYKTLSFQLNKEDVILEKEIKSIKKTFDGSHYSATMQMLEIELIGKHDLLDKWVNYKRAVTHSQVTQTKQWVDYGKFKVIEQEYQDDTDETKLLCYDGMINTYKPYSAEEMDLTYPTSIKSIFMKLCAVCELGTSTTTFDNMDMMVEEDKWANIGETTYRSILDEIAQVSTSFVAIKNDKLEIYKENVIDYTISENNLSKLKIGEKVGPINILSLAREPQHDVEYRPSDWYDIPTDERKELAFVNNQIVDKRRDEYIDSIYNGVKGLSFIEFEADTFGYGLFQVGDVVTLKEHREDKTYTTVITSEILNNTTGTTGQLGSHKPLSSKDKYVVVSDMRKEGMQTYIMVDQQNGKIEAAVKEVGELGDKTAKLEIDVDGLTSTVESIAVGDNLIYNLNGEEDMDGWSFDGGYLTFAERLRFYKGLTFNPTFVPIEVQSLSVNAIKFIRKGKAISNVAYIVPTTIYSLKMKREAGTQTFKVTVLEYDKIDGQPIKRTPFIFNNPKMYEKLSLQPSENTTHIRLEFETLDDSVLVLTEMMFTRGNPSDWRMSPSDVKAFANSEIKQLDSEIRSTVEDVKMIDGKVEENKSEIIQQSNQIELKVNKDGIIGGLNASPETVKILSDRLDFNNATGVNVDLSGKITATSGKIGGYDLVDNELKGNDVELGSSQIKIKDAIISSEVWQTVENLNFDAIASNFGRPGRMVSVNLAGDNFITQFSAGGRAVRVTSLVAMGDGDIGASSRRFKNIFLENQPNVSSDTRYKRNMKVVEGSLDMLRNVNAYRYNMKDDDLSHVGFKAQEVETYIYKTLYKKYLNDGLDKLSASRKANEKISSIAMLNKGESYLSLLYGEVHTVLWQATKEIDVELQETKQELKEVKDEVKELKELVNRLIKERD